MLYPLSYGRNAHKGSRLACLRVRLAIIGDTHMPRGTRALPPACVERLRGADAILHTGDLVTLDVLALLESLGPPVHAVHGNVDDPAVTLRLPAVRVVEAEGWRIVMTHDGGPADRRLARLRTRFADADAVVFGHSHIPLHETDERRLPDLQPRLADRAAPRAGAHDGHGDGDAGEARVRADRALSIRLTEYSV